MASLQLAFTYAPWFQSLFHTQSLALSEWVYVLGIGLAIYTLVEIEKKIRLNQESRKQS